MRTCIGCKYFEKCGDKKRTAECKGREYSEQYKDFADRVVKAYDNDEFDMLQLLSSAHHAWYINIMTEIRRLEREDEE